ncbi:MULTISPECIES: xanthine dehydrogenase accessory protein XdhC [Pseudomonadaceae]|uniref:Molybdenum cofactor sulfurylase n=1 Tax=Ectopseudomonas oleovorans TaxID=301 RepID=A0A3D9ETU3_ECTOL|nr:MULTISPECIES: xanthine dehydrogenase accessory protein XdhC [Pseudomonas]MDK4199406.1 xanthine dehydrogenase accessory protein XdhC [Pseudomonas sp. HR1]NMZ43924.1 xanthine dehydrogenase accessory protein XdhC [Pseudomonas oryzihabitans]RED06574.1 molybdenum cofactor sulfurylase [Pseudomonas oleovorans]HJE67192.1 xanthine dehydrogenase accessory protein XdhC [Pseudomonas oryzihabitans]
MTPKRGWLALLADFEARGEPCVLITVADEQGSTPREAGTKMLVGREEQHLTIGGGHLEYRAVDIAREMLAAGTRQPRLERFSLAASLGQCCGGVTTLLFEPQLAQDVPVIVFGAGHVARALVPLLAGLPCAVRWVDSRPQEFPAVLPAGVEKIVTDEPVDEIARMPAGAYYIVMTHNHPLDLELTDAILARGDHGYFGLIGSRTKWAKFRHRLAARGHGADRLATVRCPLGLPEVQGKLPLEIAIAVAGEVIAHYGRQAQQADQPLRLVNAVAPS